ncbi:MAG: PKD domain-containing protein, partial [Saprospiraceae bacterium]
MSNRLRLFCLAAFFASGLLLPNLALAQIIYGEPQKSLSLHLENQFSRWEVYKVDAPALFSSAQDHPESGITQLHLGQHHWRLDLTPNALLAPDYTVQVLGPKGLEMRTTGSARAYRGIELAGSGQLRLTLNKDFIYGFVEEGGERYYIEPLWYFEPTADRNLFVLYAAKDVNRNNSGNCAVVEGENELQHLEGNGHVKETSQADNSQACYQVDLAIASDNSMLSKYGSITGVENHNIGVINDVEGDYTGNFNHDLVFNIVTQFVVTGTDPWTNSTAPGTLLASFRTWGNAGNFGVVFDVGELWTNRDFDDNVIGIAYLNGVCNTNKYHCLQDFSGNSELLRCLTSHEMGHNFSCAHDGGTPCTTIMCPSVSFTNSWSSQSVNSVNGFITPLINNGCLSPCGPPPVPLVANFEWDPNPGCAGQPVHFTDLSTGNITGRSWTFTGATPATSTLTNPTATWSVGGTFNVKLTLTGTGGPVSITKQITITPKAVANFTYSVMGLTVNFTSTSTNATAYFWDFGDSFTSTDANPVHAYDNAGIYTVMLTASNDCGTSIKTTVVNTAPSADFEANQTSGCAPLTVQYTNLSSSNAATYIWQFQGGSPSQSSLKNPTVVYPVSGTYSVTLTASNGAGSMTTIKTNYITVQNLPSSTFTSVVNGLTVNFTNTSVNATASSWTFGDGGSSTQTSPSHTYVTGGTYTVVLSSSNACGTVTNTQMVTLISAPTAAFTATPTSGCGPLTVQFTNNSTGGATSYNWQLPGGTPSTSTAASPSVVYNTPGTYSVTLTATNAAGSNTATQTNYITVY